MINRLKKIYQTTSNRRQAAARQARINQYLNSEREPWSVGYEPYRWEFIRESLGDKSLLSNIKKQQLPQGFGEKLDERVVEYPWLLSHLRADKNRLLDAGSTFNFEIVLDQLKINIKELTIYTFAPEVFNFNERRISYVYGDLRELPFKDGWFQEIVCQSTIEHIDMDNAIYGYDLDHKGGSAEKSYDYLKVIAELERVLQPDGQLLLTCPYGIFENHGFFQQLDKEMVGKMVALLQPNGFVELEFMRYTPQGWQFAQQAACDDATSHNPHTGKGKGDDGAAHSRAICCLRFVKKD